MILPSLAPCLARRLRAVAVLTLTMTPLAAQDVAGTGRIAGRVIDRETGRPVPGARVTVLGSADVYDTDLDGRYRSVPLQTGVHAVRAAVIGFQPQQIDSVTVVAGQTAHADFAMRAAAVELAGISVEAIRTPSSDAGLLAVQQAAPVASDGISAQAISRSADSDAGDAVTRVTGISVVDNKFVIVRGLPERYSNTLLNGAELASPEPMRRIVPLDIFPASLLEAIVAMKSATPDRPGDFAGGSVEIRTKDFPEATVVQVTASQGFNTLATFERFPLAPRGGTDFLGFDDGRRALPPNAPAPGDHDTERFAEALRNVWTPASRVDRPNAGLGVNLGGQTTLGDAPLGFVASFTYGEKREFVPQRLFQLFDEADQPAVRALVYDESRAIVDWGAIANASLRLGTGSKLGFKNLYTRTARESAISNQGYDTENSRVIRSYQTSYVEQDLLQTQLTGEHQLGFLFGSRLEWKGTFTAARRDEPDNRQVQYILAAGEYAQGIVPTQLWSRFLDDQLYATQVDWAFPLSIRGPRDAQFKIGGVYRNKDRTFDARLYRWVVNNSAPNAREVTRLPPEQAFAPEHVGTVFLFERTDLLAQSYRADDDVRSYYAMLDVPIVRWLRLVGGARYEDWRLLVDLAGVCGSGDVITRWNRDLLWSANVTAHMSDRMNLRFAGFRTVSRPDAREVSCDTYIPIVGDCEIQGNEELQRTRILNGDARWEVYPRPGEVVAVSAFYKRFDAPIVEAVDVPGGGQCRVRYHNATDATTYGAEFELRRALDFLPGVLGRLAAGMNFTWVASRVAIPRTIGVYPADLALQGQSPYLINATLGYTSPGGGMSGTLLFNYFADRIARYGRVSGATQGPNVIERGRATLDARIERMFGRHWSTSLAAKNLTDAGVLFFHQATGGFVTAGSYKPGVSVSLGIGYGR